MDNTSNFCGVARHRASVPSSSARMTFAVGPQELRFREPALAPGDLAGFQLDGAHEHGSVVAARNIDVAVALDRRPEVQFEVRIVPELLDGGLSAGLMQFERARADSVRGGDEQQISGCPYRRADRDPVRGIVRIGPEKRAVIGVESETGLGRTNATCGWPSTLMSRGEE